MTAVPMRGRLTSDNALRAIALGTWLLVCLSIVLGLAIWMARGSPRLPVSFVGGAMGTSSIVMVGVAFSTAAAYLMARAPRNLIGWVFMAIGLGMAVVLPINIGLADVVRQYRLVDTPVIWLAWAVTSVQIPASGAALVVVLLLFPSGRPEWRHWRATMAVAVAGGILISAGAALRPDGLLWYPTLPNPLDVPSGLRHPLNASVALGTTLLTAALASAGTWLTWRAWHARGPQRRQLVWVVAGGLAMSVTLAPLFLARYVIHVSDALGERVVFVAALGAIAFPITVAVAVQREDLFGMRDLLGRSLVYLPLMALLAGLYTASVMIFQKVFVALTGTASDAAVVLATLLVATSLTPARNLLETIVKRSTEGRPIEARVTTATANETDTGAMTALENRLAFVEARLLELEGSASATPAARLIVPAGKASRGATKRGRPGQPAAPAHAADALAYGVLPQARAGTKRGSTA
jgi:hypothetical protein